MKNSIFHFKHSLWLLLPLSTILMTGCGSKNETATQPVSTDPQAEAAANQKGVAEAAAKQQERQADEARLKAQPPVQ